MKTYPLLDAWGASVLIVVFVVCFVWEKAAPLRNRVQSWGRRLTINLFIGAPALLVMRLLLIPAVVEAGRWSGQHGVGVVRILNLPPWLAAGVTLLLLDYSMYLWHWLNHRVLFLWRFHNVHHTDLDLDVTTAFRFHFGELLFSVAVRSLQVVLIGATPAVALVYEVLLEASTQFHHSNLRLPLRLERVLATVFVTPRVHGIHHSIEARETNSNFSNLLTIWDRLHRTLQVDVRQSQITIGVPTYRAAEELTPLRLLLMPFQRQWKCPLSNNVPNPNDKRVGPLSP